MLLGREQRYHPDYSLLEKTYIALLGMPVVGLRIRGRNIFYLIPKKQKYRHILDAGSGPGVFSFELARRFPDSQILGVDLLRDPINACQHIAQKTNIKNAKFRQTSLEDLTEKNTFDLVVCVDIMEHIEADQSALNNLYQVMAPGGILVLHVPAMYRRYPVWKKMVNFDVVTHVRPGYEPHEIKTKVQQAGFFIQKSGFTYGFWETLANNLSYMITGARKQNKVLYALAFPFLHLISLIGYRARPVSLGAGFFVIAKKELHHE
ncbi:MAG: class I SAM-dependent methyltransferase [Candidatus Electrothrix sp. AX2]|nr:class I SAM-dependent methyltransferase [Candidatus Electrothrix gigas]